MNGFSRPRAVVFDLWFTLISPDDFRDPGVRTMTAIPKALGLEPEPFREFWEERSPQQHKEARLLRDYISEYVAGLGRSLTNEDLIAFDSVWRFHDQALASPRPRVLEALAKLEDDGYQLGLLSNAHEREIRTWDSSPLAQHFSAACFSCHLGSVKPEPEAYARVLELLGVPANAALFVGDGASGELTGARSAGFAGSIFMRGFLQQDGVSENVIRGLAEDADAIIDDIHHLFPLLDSAQQERP